MSKIFSICLICLLFPVSTFASFFNVEVDGIIYKVYEDSKEAEVQPSSSRYSGDIVIPEFITYSDVTYRVTSICGFARRVSSGAFQGCSELTSISIPKSINRIGLNAFEGCSSLKAVHISDLSAWCKIDFTMVDYAVTLLPNPYANPLYYAHDLYVNNHKQTELYIPDDVLSILPGAFMGCSISSLKIHKFVKDIGFYAFFECNNITDIYIYGAPLPNYGNNTTNVIFSDVENTTLHIRERYKDLWPIFKNVVYIDGIDFHLIYIIDNKVYRDKYYEVGEAIVPENEPTKEGYTFSGWSEIPETMPDHDVTVTGTFSPNIYKLTYKVDEKDYKVCELKCDSIITPEPEPTRKGMTFSGWSEIPEKMPAKDVTVTGTFSWTKLTKDKVVYEVADTLNNYCKVIGNDNASGEIKIDSVEIDGGYYQPTEIADKAFYGCKDITKVEILATVKSIGERAFANIDKLTDVTCWAEEVPTTDRTAFENSYIEDYVTLHVPYGAIEKYKEAAPWKNFKEIVAIEESQRTYTLTYKVDGEVYKTFEIKEGEQITPEAEPAKEGYKFSGWSEIPETMPDHDVTISGTFAINKYKLTYMVDDEVYTSYEIEYYAAITPEADPTKEGYTFSGWSEIPERMPAKDVTVTGTFTQDVYEEGGNSYTIDEDGATIVKGEDKEGEVVINATIVINGKTYKVIVIGESAFKGGTKMSAVVIPDAIKIIGASAFEGCSRLKNINIGKGVLAIDHKAFANIGSGAGAVGTRAGEVGLKVSCSAETVPATDDDVFENTDIENATLVVNDNLVDSYKSTMPWNGFGTIMGFEEATGIDDLLSEPQGAVIYSIDGRRLSKVQKGLNVVRSKDGVKKVVWR